MIISFPRGIDVSHWSGTIDWATVRKQPEAQFAIAKCTEGLDFLDIQYANNRTGCLTQGIPFGAYHFYRHNGRPQDQADWFESKIGEGVSVAVCDVETTTAIALVGEERYKQGVLRGAGEYQWQAEIINARNALGLLSASGLSYQEKYETVALIDSMLATLEDDIYTFCERCIWHGLEPTIYTSPGFAKSFFKTNKLAKYPLWIANVQTSKPTIPAPGAQYGEWPNNPKVPIWQDTWTLEVEGIPEAAVDGNLWSPAAGNLYDWFGNGSQYQEPGDVMTIKVNTPNSYANIRNKIWGTITGKAPHGLTLTVTGQANDSNGRLWYQCGTGWLASWVVEVVG